MTLSPARLAELEALANAATPGPWNDDEGSIRDGNDTAIAHIQEHSYVPTAMRLNEDYSRRDAAFIATARTAMPELIAALRESQARAKTAEEVLATCWDHRCSDKVGGCTAVSADALRAWESLQACCDEGRRYAEETDGNSHDHPGECSFPASVSVNEDP